MIPTLLTAIEEELKKTVCIIQEPLTQIFHEMITYHMGWTGDGSGPEAQGKRIRPLLVLLTASACGSEWSPVLPAATAVELVHNFSLVHDDIQDNSPSRRRRQTVWVKWGIPQGINVGDALFVISDMAIMDLRSFFSPDVVLQAANILHGACLNLTRGQFLDMQFEGCAPPSIEEYWIMVSGKTAALLSASCEIGALLGGGDLLQQESCRDFGHYLGLAFQVQDDILGIWGDSDVTGKSADSDLVTGKKTLPVLLGLQKSRSFAKRWNEGSIRSEEVASLAEVLIEDGVLLVTQQIADQMTDQAIQSLRLANLSTTAGEELFSLAKRLLERKT